MIDNGFGFSGWISDLFIVIEGMFGGLIGNLEFEFVVVNVVDGDVLLVLFVDNIIIMLSFVSVFGDDIL